MNEDEREKERLGLRGDMRKANDASSECHRLLDVVGVPTPELVIEYKMPGYHDFEKKLGGKNA